VVVLIVALVVPYSSQAFQQQIALTLQGSALAPFIAMQERLAEGRARAEQIDLLQATLDSIVAATTTQSVLADENRQLRELLGLRERAGPRFLSATLLRPGTPGSESMFMVNVGAEDGVTENVPVVSARGLVGVIREVRPRSAVGIDWTHLDFRASAMLADGSMFGLVENVRGDFREEDRLMLNGTAFHETAPPGALVVTSGMGRGFPRGIPIGRIDATAEVQGGWRKSYWLRPAVDVGAVTHVLVETAPFGDDLSSLWVTDTVVVDAPPPARPPVGRGSAAPPTRPTATPPERTAPAPRPAATPTPPAEAQSVAPTDSAEPRPADPRPTSDSVAPRPDSVTPAPAPTDSAAPARDSVPASPA